MRHDGAMSDRESEWRWVTEERLALAAALESLAPDAWDEPSLCDGWRVRDVVGHLVSLAEASRVSMFLDVSRQFRPPDVAISRIAQREGRAAPEELTRRLRAASEGRFVVPSQPPAAALGEVIVHGIDALRPVGGEEPERDGERTEAVAHVYRRIGPVFGTGRVARRVRFDATDAGWSIGPDDGPVAAGTATDVLLALAGRPGGRAALTGPGADLLRA